MKALVICTAWILGGLVVTGGLFWMFLNTPESTVWTLGASLLLVLAMYVVISLMWSGALVGWSRGWSAASVRRASNGIAACLPPALLVGAAWWIVGVALGWMNAFAGEIGAWFMVQFGWSDIRPLLTAVNYAGNWLRMVVVPFAALVWLGVLLERGWRPLVDRAWVARALSPQAILLATAVAWLTIVAPITYATYWRPLGLPISWVEPAFAAMKLGAMCVLAAVGLSLITKTAAPRRS
jgi:hypothetical protein